MGKTNVELLRSEGGTKEERVPIAKVVIPDIWHIANAMPDRDARDKVLEVWHLAHDLLKHASKQASLRKD